MNIIFMGTPQISVDVLTKLIQIENINLLGVICQPDKQKNRKNEIMHSPVKKFCIDKNITIYQPEKIIDLYDELVNLEIDLIITCAYGQFIPDKILYLAKNGSYNLHASLLPKLRGGAPIHWAIINGFNETGITLMKMVKKMDAGDIIAQNKCTISKDETTKSLTIKLGQLAADLLEQNLPKLSHPNNINCVLQNEDEVTFGLNIKKEDRYINFESTAIQIDQKVRGLYDKPIALWKYNDIEIKIYKCSVTNKKSIIKPGEISHLDKTGIYIATGDYDICFTEIQLPNKNVQKISDLINGNHPFTKK